MVKKCEVRAKQKCSGRKISGRKIGDTSTLSSCARSVLVFLPDITARAFYFARTSHSLTSTCALGILRSFDVLTTRAQRDGLSMIPFAEIRDRLTVRLPRPDTSQIAGEPFHQAAVVLILRDSPRDTELLLIQRAENPRDVWSGHLALPGGRASGSDSSLLSTAAREVDEEVGIQLSHSNHFLGQLTRLSPSNPQLPLITVTPFVAMAPDEFELRPSPEVGAAFWAPVTDLLNSGRSATKEILMAGGVHRWPAYPSERGPIWGITERIITEFLAHLD